MAAGDSPDSGTTKSFPHTLDKKTVKSLEVFVLRHNSHSRPIALVTSGGTAADLEQRAVRSLDNFSTGTRGAISVEQFLSKGYAVVHLWRSGSAAPFGRILSQALGMAQANHGVSFASLANLLQPDGKTTSGSDGFMPSFWSKDIDPLEDENPWVSDVDRSAASPSTCNGLSLNDRLVHHGKLQAAWREYQQIEKEGRLLTIPFRTLEEYLGRLQLCAEVLNESQSLALLYLAAAVSDYYFANKAEHKIQSSNEELVLTLQPVPKVMGILREQWAPQAYCVSFKLETDPKILRQKAQRAVDRYGVHMVIGNILNTRTSQVWVLNPSNALGETWLDITKPVGEALIEEPLLDHVVEQHFGYIAQNHPNGARTHELWRERQRKLRRELLWQRIQDGVLEVAGPVLGLVLTYMVSRALQKRM